MRKILKKAKEGFTLIELMIVVAIVGILAVLAVYGVRKYIANSKTTEAKNSLGQMSKDAATAYEKEGMAGAILGQGTSTSVLRALCTTASANVPSVIGSVQAKKYQSAPTEWNADSATAGKGYACLKFSMDQPQYYMYSYTSASTSQFVAGANGDLNGDGTQSTFTIQGSVVNQVLNVAPNISETTPEE